MSTTVKRGLDTLFCADPCHPSIRSTR